MSKPSSGLVTPASYSSSNKAPSTSANKRNADDATNESAKSTVSPIQNEQLTSKIEQSLKITPPKTSNLPASKLTKPAASTTSKTSPATARKIPLPGGQIRRTSDSTLGLQTKSRLEIGSAQQQQKIKKLSDLSRNDSVIQEKDDLESSKAKSEIKGLRHPIVGGGSMLKTPKYSNNNNKTQSNNNRVLKFQPNPTIPKPVLAESAFKSDTISNINDDNDNEINEESDVDLSCDVTPTNERVVSEQDDILPNKTVSENDISPNENDTLPSEYTDNELEGITLRQPFGKIHMLSDDEDDEDDQLSISQNSTSHLPENDPFSEFDNNGFNLSKVTGANDFDISNLTGANDFDISKLTGIDAINTSTSEVVRKVSSSNPQNNTAKGIYNDKYESDDDEDSDIDSDNPKSVYDDPDIRTKSIDGVTVDNNDPMKRSEQLSSDSGYIEPLEYLSSSRTSIANSNSGSGTGSGLRKHSLTNVEDGFCYSSSESNPSPRFGEQQQQQHCNDQIKVIF